jgi:hypothetical protein
VVNLGAEEDLGGDHGVLVRQEQLKLEQTALVGGVRGAGNLHEEMPAVRLGRLRVDSNDWTNTAQSLIR